MELGLAQRQGRTGAVLHLECRRLAVLGLRQLRLRMQALGALPLVIDQAGDQFGRWRLQEARGELVQQAADFVGAVIEQGRFTRVALAQGLRARQRMFEQARQMRQIGKADGSRIASQRMGQRHARIGHRLMQLVSPLGQFGAQTARLFVGLVEKDIEQRNADAQCANHLVRFGFGFGFAFRFRLGRRHEQREWPARLGRHRRRWLDDVERHQGRDLVRARAVVLELGQCQGLQRCGSRHGQVGCFAQVELEGHFVIATEHLVDRLDRRCGRPQLKVLRTRQLGQQIEQGHRRRHLRYRQCRRGRARPQAIKCGRQLALGQHDGRARQGQRRVLAVDAESVNRALDIERTMAAVATLADGFNPVTQVRQHVGGQGQQFAIGGLAVGQAAVVELLAGPGGFTEGRQTDHARAALQGVEGTPHAGHLAEVFGGGHQRGQRLLGIADHFARLLKEDLAHFVVVFKPGSARWRRRGRQHGRRPRGSQGIERGGFR